MDLTVNKWKFVTTFTSAGKVSSTNPVVSGSSVYLVLQYGSSGDAHTLSINGGNTQSRTAGAGEGFYIAKLDGATGALDVAGSKNYGNAAASGVSQYIMWLRLTSDSLMLSGFTQGNANAFSFGAGCGISRTDGLGYGDRQYVVKVGIRPGLKRVSLFRLTAPWVIQPQFSLSNLACSKTVVLNPKSGNGVGESGGGFVVANNKLFLTSSVSSKNGTIAGLSYNLPKAPTDQASYVVALDAATLTGQSLKFVTDGSGPATDYVWDAYATSDAVFVSVNLVSNVTIAGEKVWKNPAPSLHSGFAVFKYSHALALTA